MNRGSKSVLLGLTVLLLLSAALPVYAAGRPQALPPLPEWPIIGPLLRWLGLVPAASTPTPTPPPTPTPAIPEYRITHVRDLVALAKTLKAGERVRLVATAEELQKALNAYISTPGQRQGLRSATVTLGQETFKAQVTIDRTALEKMGMTIPISSDTLQLDASGTLGAADCYLTVTLTEVRVNGEAFPLLSFGNQLLNDMLVNQWPPEACVEQISMTPAQVAVEGYRR